MKQLSQPQACQAVCIYHPTCMMRLHSVEAEVPGGEDAEAGVETRVDEAPVVQPVVGHHWATGIGYN